MSGFLPASIFLLLLRTVSSQTVSIQYVSAYTSQRDCAFACQGINPDDADVIANYLTCDTEPLENSCFCRSDLQAKAENHISTCVQSMCGDTEDATSAVSIYEAYCTSAGFQAAGNTPATTTANAQSSSSTSTNTNTGSSTEDSSNSSGKMFGPLTEADFIGLIVAIVGVIIAAVGVYYQCVK
ncbi:hypothetical protein V8E51_013716 [Hyaloscypha variabilis]